MRVCTTEVYPGCRYEMLLTLKEAGGKCLSIALTIGGIVPLGFVKRSKRTICAVS